jgi:NAD(P)-dependent dehydrogenase (short-subunit alcohol dehydrogenase family)
MELGCELAPEGIRVNAVSPSSILFPGGGWDSLRERDPERVERFVKPLVQTAQAMNESPAEDHRASPSDSGGSAR